MYNNIKKLPNPTTNDNKSVLNSFMFLNFKLFIYFNIIKLQTINNITKSNINYFQTISSFILILFYIYINSIPSSSTISINIFIFSISSSLKSPSILTL